MPAKRWLWRLVGVVLLALPAAAPAWAQEEVTSPLYRYGQREVIRDRYEKYEVRPRAPLPAPGPVRRSGVLLYGPTPQVRNRQYLPDAHAGLKFYYSYTCSQCHPQQARSILTTRAGITCRQCHGPEPIAAVKHYYSPLNPIRRHAYICAKCHQGANASFATYRVHAPEPWSRRALKEFPALFYVFWAMAGIALVTLVLFLPHTLLWGLRELWSGKEKRTDGDD